MYEQSAPTSLTPDGLPLAGLRVIDMADGRGETCGRLLADLGADVLRIEPPAGAASRTAPPMFHGTSLFFVTHNTNKRGRVLDLTTDDGRYDLLELVADADILVESMRPGRLAGLGLSVETLHEVNPALVITSITDFGQTGPYRDWAATDFVHMALNSVLARSGNAGHRPLMPPGSLPTELAAVQAVWSTLVALWHRLATGVGDHVDVSILESSIQSLDPLFGMGGTATAGMVASDLPRHRPDARRNYAIFACKDGWVRICVASRRQWLSLFRWLGGPEQFSHKPWDDKLTPQVNAAGLYALCEDFVRDLTRAECAEAGRAYGVPIEGMATPGEVLDSEHFRVRGAWAPAPLPDGVTGVMPNGFVEIDGTRAGVRAPAPALGGAAIFDKTRPNFAPWAPRQVDGRNGGPLSGVRVLDLGVIVVGAETSRLFADMGADVVKVETRSYPDGVRMGSINTTFAYGHRNKRSLGINLRSSEGKELFLKLVAEADVVLSNFKPSTLDSLGLGFDVLKAANPAIVAVESSAMGTWGPASRAMGYGPLVRAVCGLTTVWRYPERPDGFCDNITIYPDHSAARIGAVSALAGLLNVRRTGVGTHTTVAQSESILGELGEYFLHESVEPGAFHAVGNTREHDAPYGVYECAGDDEWCVVTVRGDDDWQRLCTVIDAADLAGDDTLSSASGRVAQRERIDERLGAWIRGRTPHHVQTLLQDAGVPAARMLRAIELPLDPHIISRGFFLTLSQPQTGDLLTETGPARFEHIDPPDTRQAPAFAQHTGEVVHEWLGLGEEDVATFIAQGVLEVP